MSIALSSTERARLIDTGAISPPCSQSLQTKRAMWHAAVRKAKAAFEELAYAERSYLAALEREKSAVRRMPKTDPYKDAA